MGNLTADVETRKGSGNEFQTFAVAHNYGKDDKKVTTFVGCIASGKVGENIAKYFSKGKPIIVEGSLRQGKQSLYVSVNSFHFVGSAKKESEQPKQDNKNDEIPFWA